MLHFKYTTKWFSFILFQIVFHYRLFQGAVFNSPCYTVGLCWLSIMYIVVCANFKFLTYFSPFPPFFLTTANCISETLLKSLLDLGKKKKKSLYYIRRTIRTVIIQGFPNSSVGKESRCNAEDPSWISGSGRSNGERIGSPLQYFVASLVA